MSVFNTICSNCSEDLEVDTQLGTVTSIMHHELTTEFTFTDDTPELLMWDCPHCDYADSYDLTQDEDDEPVYEDPLRWERESYNRDLEEQALGRPLFPNEY